MAKKVQEYANIQQLTEGIPDMVSKIANVCNQACKELEVEYDAIKKINS